MRLWKKAIQLERSGKGFGLTGKLTKERIINGMCPSMYSDPGMTDYCDKKYSFCQDFSYDMGYTPCNKCWSRRYRKVK